MARLGSFIIILNLLCPTISIPACGDDIFSSEEMRQLQKGDSVEHRIKIYQAASERIQQNLQQSVAKEEFKIIPDTLKTWTLLLTKSLEDIETNLKTKTKPRSLINYEIHVRKAIGSTEGYKLKAPADQQDAFNSCISQANSAHKKFVEILFRLKS
jgi:hypothetical protein